MKYVRKVKEGDCFICAYASCEQITWKQSLRRCRRKGITREKFGAVSLKEINIKGFKNYTLAKKGSFNSMPHMFKFKQGILLVSWGNGKGHAVFFNGYKLVCHEESGRLNNMNSFNFKLPEGASIVTALIKENTNMFKILRNYLMYFFLLIKNTVFDKLGMNL